MLEDFKKRYQQLNAEQRDAVDAIDGPVLVIAGPGTGKTQLLSMRVANILQKTDSAAHNILCLTFTESAAHEMRQRLAAMIGQQAYNVTISTYHSFGSELIQRYPQYFSDMPNARPIDQLNIHTIVENIIQKLPYSDPLKSSIFYIQDVTKTISDCKRALLEPDDVRAVAKDNLDFIKSTSLQTKKLLATITRMNKDCVPLFEELLTTQKPTNKDQKVVNEVVKLPYLFNSSLAEALEEVTETGKTTPLTKWKNAWLERDEQGLFVVKDHYTNQRLLALADVYEQYVKELQSKQLFDYDDMILRAISGLKDFADFRFSLQEQYQYLLLDEFQDTNAAQLELVKLLTDNPVYEKKPNVLAVGDDDQAIFSFQGADYSHMLAFKETYSDVKIVTLTKNYRSHPDILHVAHGISNQIEERLHHRFDDIQKTLSAESTSLPKDGAIERHEFKSDVAQFGWVAKQIAIKLEKGVSANEIAIIAPQHKHLEPLIPYLQKAGVPVRYEKRENVLEDIHILQLTRMSELVIALNENALDLVDALLPEVLSYDFWNIPTTDIWQLSWQANEQKTRWSNLLAGDANYSQIFLFFTRLGSLSNTETLESMLDHLIGIKSIKIDDDDYTSPMYQYNFGSHNQKEQTTQFWNLLSNLTVLRQHLREHWSADKSVLGLSDFVQFIDEHNNAKIKILNTSPYHESAEAVQMMTAYKAKGLEFESVYLLACLDDAWGTKARGQYSKISLPLNLQHARFAGATNDEQLRLFFVAITRAKHNLFLTSYANTYSNKLTTRLQYLNEINVDDQAISPLLPTKSQTIIQNDATAPNAPDLSAYWHTKHSMEVIKNADIHALLEPKLQSLQLAPTHINSFTDVIHGGPQHYFMNTILKFPKAPSPYSEYGNAVHEVIDWVHLQNKVSGKLPTINSVIKEFNARLDLKQLNTQDKELMAKRGQEALTIYMNKRAHLFSADNEHEYDFKREGVFVGDAHISGKIDRLIIDKKSRTISIVDFKTGKSYSKWNSSELKLHKYKQQLYFYKLLVEGSQKFANYTVTDAYLEFVEPDTNGNIVELHVQFDQNYMQHIKQLIRAVWQSVMKLEFPSLDSYQPSVKGIVQFEEDLIKTLPQ